MPNELKPDSDFPCASQHRKEGALAVTHSPAPHPQWRNRPTGSCFSTWLSDQCFYVLSVTLLAAAASAFTAGGGARASVGLWNETARCCSNAML